MGTAIFMVLMVCGYWYTSRDLSTRFKIKRSFGWDVYFLVALYGCIFVLQGVLATGLIWLLLLGLSVGVNTFHLAPQHYANWQIEFMNWSFLGIQAPVVIMLALPYYFVSIVLTGLGAQDWMVTAGKSCISAWRSRAVSNNFCISVWKKVSWRW